MAGTKSGGILARETNKAKYGADYYTRIGKKGGEKGTTGGFWYKKYVLNDVESIKKAGEKGGAISRRGKK
jgi:general stress protein YciG